MGFAAMTVDSSAILTVLLREEGYEAVEREFANAVGLHLSAATYVECHAVVMRARRPELIHLLEDFLATHSVQIAPLTAEQAQLAVRAYRDYGRGTGHAANLNLGDTFSYALAKSRFEPLLCTGDDLRHTDLRTRPEPTA
jgi:ribonuclease VapC